MGTRRECVAAYGFNGSRRGSREFVVRRRAHGLWSDGSTIWVSNRAGTEEVIQAYDLSSGARIAAADITTRASRSRGSIWSDGFSLWLTLEVDAGVQVFAYPLSGDRDPVQDEIEWTIDPSAGADLTDGDGLWSDGHTIWVASANQNKLLAYVAIGAVNNQPPQFRRRRPATPIRCRRPWTSPRPPTTSW